VAWQGQTYPRGAGLATRCKGRPGGMLRGVDAGSYWGRAPAPPSFDEQLWLGRLGLVDDPPQPRQAVRVDFFPLSGGQPNRALHELLVGWCRGAATRTFGLFHLAIVFD